MRLRWVAGVVALGFCLIGYVGSAAGQAITGTAEWNERIALPPGAVFEAVLEEISSAGTPAVELGQTTIESPGNPPFEFVIPYDPTVIEPRGRYSVRTRVMLGDRLMFASDSQIPVLTQGAGDTIDVTMRMIDRPRAPVGITSPVIGAHGMRLPASFRGDLPCADCAGLRYQLNLWPDQVFHLRRQWLGQELTRDAIGRWWIDPERGSLVLWGAEEELRFEILAPDQLRLLGRDDAPILFEPNHDLTAADELLRLNLRLPMRGEVTFMAESGLFSECLTGRQYPLAPEGDVATLQAAYLAAGIAPGSPLLTSFDGAFTEVPRPDGEGDGPAVQVERFIGVWPDESCERAVSEASLTNTYWRILRLGETEIAAADDRREPHLILRSGEDRFSATVGCNEMIGGFEQEGSRLGFRPAASPKMACPPPLDDWESKLNVAIASAVSWTISSQALELLDADGVPLALFQAVYLR